MAGVFIHNKILELNNLDKQVLRCSNFGGFFLLDYRLCSGILFGGVVFRCSFTGCCCPL